MPRANCRKGWVLVWFLANDAVLETRSDRDEGKNGSTQATLTAGGAAAGNATSLADVWRQRQQFAAQDEAPLLAAQSFLQSEGASQQGFKEGLRVETEHSQLVNQLQEIGEQVGLDEELLSGLRHSALSGQTQEVYSDVAHSLGRSMERATALQSQVEDLMHAHAEAVEAANKRVVEGCAKDPKMYTADTAGVAVLNKCVLALEALAQDCRKNRAESEHLNTEYSALMMKTVKKLHKVIDPKQTAAKLAQKSKQDQQFAHTNLMKQVRDVKANLHVFMGDAVEESSGADDEAPGMGAGGDEGGQQEGEEGAGGGEGDEQEHDPGDDEEHDPGDDEELFATKARLRNISVDKQDAIGPNEFFQQGAEILQMTEHKNKSDADWDEGTNGHSYHLEHSRHSTKYSGRKHETEHNRSTWLYRKASGHHAARPTQPALRHQHPEKRP